MTGVTRLTYMSTNTNITYNNSLNLYFEEYWLQIKEKKINC